MNCESWLDPKNSRMAAITGLAFTRSCGMAVDISWYTDIFSLMARSMRTKPMRNWFSSSSPDRAHAAVAQVIDVVHRADAPAQLQQVLDGVDEVLLIERALVERRFIDLVVQLDVELHAAHAREVVLARVEEHALEELGGGIERGRIAGTQLAVDLEQRVVLALHRVLPQGDGNHVAGVVALGEEHLEGRDAVVHQLFDVGQFVVGFHQHFAGGHVDDVGGDIGALQIGAVDFHLLDLGFENGFVQRSW